MHILLINDSTLPSARGGAAVMVEYLRQELVRRGNTVSILTSHQDASQPSVVRREDSFGKTFSIYAADPGCARHWHCVQRPPFFQTINDIMKELQPDIVHAHVIHQFLTYDCLRIAKLYTDTIFLTAHDTFSISFNRIRSQRYIDSVLENKDFHLHMTDHLLDAGRKYNPFRNRKIRTLLHQTGTKVIAVSRAIESILNAHGIMNTATIHNGIPESKTPSSEERQDYRNTWNLSGPTVLYGGRIGTDKGIEVLLNAMALVLEHVSDAQLLVAGDKERLTTFIERLPHNVENCIRTTGWISQDEMRYAYASADVVTTPSIYLDAFPTINLEAMAQSRPVVGTCFGGTPEVIENGVNGYIVNPLDTPKFADRLTELLSDPVLANTMGSAGFDRLQNSFSIGCFADAHSTLYS